MPYLLNLLKTKFQLPSLVVLYTKALSNATALQPAPPSIFPRFNLVIDFYPACYVLSKYYILFPVSAVNRDCNPA